MIKSFTQKYIGDRAFYRIVLTIAIPLIIQQGITSFVTLLDNLMVGALGTVPLSGVSIVNQVGMVFNLTLFGGLSGASIFGAQFFGIGDWKGMRDTFRFRMLFGIGVTALAVVVFLIWGDSLCLLFLENENNSAEDIAATLAQADAYLRIAVWGLIPFMISQVYVSLLRETGETMQPMIASVIAILTNLILNYIFIFGKLGMPAMGVAGAALATVIARVLEAGYVLLYTHIHHDTLQYIEGAYRSPVIPKELCRRIILTGTPLMFNEMLWSLGMTVISGNYALRGLEVVAASNIASSAWNLFCIVMMAMGSVVAIMVGQQLGAGNIEGAKDIDRKLIFITEVIHIGIGILLLLTASLVPMLYEVEQTTRDMAAAMLRIQGIVLPIHAYIHVAYFTIRSGGKTVVTFLFDCFYTWCVPVVVSFVLCRFTDLPIVTCYALVQATDLIKMGIAMPMLKSGFWAKNVIK
ncbi:MAG: MATE family efflux transporter [Ruminococcaceae bacterium]|nr:MATE family efflux transporter [Oscillospiraceae bacterium]